MIAQQKELFRTLYKELDIPVHMTPEWMDAVCIKGDWDVIISQKESGDVEGFLVYHYRTILGFRFILMPPMCFYGGVWINYAGIETDYQRNSIEQKLCSNLIKQLPSFSFYYQQFHTSFTNWSAFYWSGFKQSTRYTYQIDTRRDKEELWSNLKANLRRNIKKAENICELRTTSFDEFWESLHASYTDRKNPFNKALLQRIYNALNDSNACELTLCVDKESKRVLAGNFLVFDKNCSYYLCGFYNPEGKEKAGLSYLLWHNISNNKKALFDFEGSMIKEIEYFFRAFSGSWKAHHRIWKINSFLSPLIRWKFKNVLNA